MQFYLYDLNTLKPRIKNLHKSLSALPGIEVTLGQCRDLVSKSLGWAHWNEMFLAHQKRSQHSPDYNIVSDGSAMVARGRFVEQEDTQRHLLMALAGLLIESFEQYITSTEQAVDLAGLVWVSNRKATLPDDHADKIHAQDIPVTHWRDSVWVDTQDGNLLVERECFRNRVLLPIMAKHGGVMFCRIGELREVMNMCKASDCVPYVIVDAEYADVYHDNMVEPAIAINQLDWSGQNEVLLTAALIDLVRRYPQVIPLYDVSDAQLKALISGLIIDGVLVSPSHECARELLNAIPEKCAEPLWLLLEEIATSHLAGNPLSLTDMLKGDRPLVVVGDSHHPLSRLVALAVLEHAKQQTADIARLRQPCNAHKPPKLLVWGLFDRFEMPGFALSPIMMAEAGWSVVVFQQQLKRFLHQEEQTFRANVSNVIALRKDTLTRKLTRSAKALWYNVRHYTGLRKGESLDAIQAVANYDNPERQQELDGVVKGVGLIW